jgi:hypothetical protein
MKAWSTRAGAPTLLPREARRTACSCHAVSTGLERQRRVVLLEVLARKDRIDADSADRGSIARSLVRLLRDHRHPILARDCAPPRAVAGARPNATSSRIVQAELAAAGSVGRRLHVVQLASASTPACASLAHQLRSTPLTVHDAGIGLSLRAPSRKLAYCVGTGRPSIASPGRKSTTPKWPRSLRLRPKVREHEEDQPLLTPASSPSSVAWVFGRAGCADFGGAAHQD